MPERRGFGMRGIGWWPTIAAWWMGMAFFIAFVLAVTVLGVFGTGDRGTELALRATARWSFLLFWPAYVGSAMARVFGPSFDRLARRGREFGLAFASAQFVHVGLVLWLYYIATGPGGAMVFFWVGILSTYLLALFSLPQLRDALGPRIWRMVCTIVLEYIALAFAADFILARLQTDGLSEFPLTYLPFVLMLVGGASLRIAAFWDRKLQQLRGSLSLRVHALPKVSDFGGMFGETTKLAWLLLIFVGVIFVSLSLDGALWGLFDAALVLYGPSIALFVAYILLKLAVRRVKFVGSQIK